MMSEPIVIVVAEMIAKPGKADELRAVLKACIAPTRAETACLQYDLHESTEKPGNFVFFERWASRQALTEHLATPHLTALGAALPALLASEARILTYHKIA
jgi:quinol monooxygenase YgiN